MGYWGFPRYVPVAEKRVKAARSLKDLMKKNPNMKPIRLEGSAIAKTWWGKAWNTNLERYADFSNRIGRGRSYVRNGTVLDLQIEAGQVKSLVQGSRAKPYAIAVQIEEIPPGTWKEIAQVCEGKLDSLQELLMGKFPKGLADLFTEQGKGLFPSPKEIEFSCSCPDWASMCKHVAATLYGIGSRLDEDPSLFFKLRKVEMKDLVSKALEHKRKDLLKRAEKKSGRLLDRADLSKVFGIDMEGAGEIAVPKAPRPKKVQCPKEAPGTSSKKPSPTPSPKRPPTEKPTPKAIKGTPLERVLKAIKGSRTKKGVDTAFLVRKTGLSDKEIWSIIQRLKKQGMVRSGGRGYYVLNW